MLKPNVYTQGNVTAITDAVQHLTTDTVNLTALELSCFIKRAEECLAAIRGRLRPAANQDFQQLQIAEAGKGQWNIRNIASVTAYTPASTWKLPPELLDRKNAVDRDIKAAKKDGTAEKIVPKIDPTSSALFAITVTTGK